MKLQGTVVEIFDLVQVGQNNTTKGGFLIEIGEPTKSKKVYFNTWAKFAQDLILKKGTTVEVEFDIDSRQWKDKWFTEATARSVSNLGTIPAAEPSRRAAAVAENTPNEEFRVKDNPNDSPLPF